MFQNGNRRSENCGDFSFDHRNTTDGFLFDHLAGPPLGSARLILFTAAQNLMGFFPQNSCPGSFNFSFGGKLRSKSSAAASFT